MKRNVKTGEGSVEQLRQFLSYSDKLAEEIKRAARQKRAISRDPVAKLTRFAEMTDNMHHIGDIPFPEYGAVEVIHAADAKSAHIRAYAPDSFGEPAPTPQAKAQAQAPQLAQLPVQPPIQPFTPPSYEQPIEQAPIPASEQPLSPSLDPNSFRGKFALEAEQLGNVKVRDKEPVEIDGRKATMGNPVWERVSRGDKEE
jgi:hypothetical protein